MSQFKEKMEVPSMMFGAIVATALVLFLALAWACYQINADADDYMKLQRQTNEIRSDRDFAYQKLNERERHCR